MNNARIALKFRIEILIQPIRHLKKQINILIVCVLTTTFLYAQPQKEIFIPLANRTELKIDPDIDTLEDGTDHFFKYEISPGYKISQSFFDKGLATLYDSFIVVRPKSNVPKGNEKSALRFIITNQQKTRILLMKEFVIKSDGKLYPLLPKPKTNVIKLVPDFVVERNKVYNKKEFTDRPKVLFYENEYSDSTKKINAVRLTLIKGHTEKHMRSMNDTLSGEMIREIKKVRGNTTVFMCLEVPQPRNKVKNVWSRFFLTD